MKVPVTPCPRCGDRLDQATAAFGPNARPEPGDITMCLRCGHLMSFTRKLKLRELTKAERRKTAGDPRLTFAEQKRREVMAKSKH